MSFGIHYTPIWQTLLRHHREAADWQMRDLFARDRRRFERFSLEAGGLLLDYSRNRISEETIALLAELARIAQLPEMMAAMRNGQPINVSEGRSVLHVALRHRGDTPYLVNGEDVMPAVRGVLDRMRSFVDSVHSGSWRGHTGETITDVVNIGIGGSDLGPRMVVEALEPFLVPGVRAHFLSNVDPEHTAGVLAKLDPARTLFVVVSKSFTTLETGLNAQAARAWFLGHVGKPEAIAQHFVAVTTNVKAATEFGISPENLFEFWDWVGGRYSVWSAVGLVVALAVGMEAFEDFLDGGYRMDQHFFEAPLEHNLPVLLGLIGIWYNTFFKAHTHAVIPYCQALAHLPAHLQQVDMESNGKRRGRFGERLDFDTGPVIWGDVGVNVQHAFFQLLHQGTRLVPCDFIAAVNPRGDEVDAHQEHLLSNCFAQAQALMRGKTAEEARAEMQKAGVKPEMIHRLLPHKVFPGNQPSNVILMPALTPHALGALLAAYEHKVFVQGVIWGINSFDQWGVEYGKQLAKETLQAMRDPKGPAGDPGMAGIIDYYRRHRRSDGGKQ